MTRVLVLGLDPATVPGLDAEEVRRGLAHGQARFAERGISADLGLVPLDETAEQRIAELVARSRYECVVIGGGIRRPEALTQLLTSEMPPEHRGPGSYMHDALELRDQWESRLLRTSSWSPLF